MRVLRELFGNEKARFRPSPAGKVARLAVTNEENKVLLFHKRKSEQIAHPAFLIRRLFGDTFSREGEGYDNADL